MKSTVSNLLSFKLTLISFVLTGLFLLASADMHAQAPVKVDVYTTPNVTYVSPGTAISRVEIKTVELKNQYSILISGTQAYNENEAKYLFYTAILDSLNDGKGVKESLQAGLNLFATDVTSALSKTAMTALRQEAINLLKQ